MHLSPDMLETAYEFLRRTSPFKRWRLPPGDEVEFQVKVLDYYADHRFPIRPSNHAHHCIRVNPRKHPDWHELLRTMAHEMVHVHQRRLGVLCKRRYAMHGPWFQKHARQVCRAHGWSLDGF